MKKFFVFLFLCVFFTHGAFSEAEEQEQEEVDFLLFQPNSSAQFVNEDQAMLQLDNLAEYLTGRTLIPGQIHVYGYAAAVMNDIEPVNFSRERAFFVINELKKRGVTEELFSDPVGYGSVDFWGNNENEEDRSPNRRVRVVLDGKVLTPALILTDDSSEIISGAVIDPEKINDAPGSPSNRKLLILLIIAVLIIPLMLFLIFKSKKRSDANAVKQNTDIKPGTEPVIIPVPPSLILVNLEDEIRMHAYKLYLERNGCNVDSDGDWYGAVMEVCARYEAQGYHTDKDDGYWQARRTSA